ncbi:hypothetical protein EDB86DRAFT_940416 [Lactarius hatsudake]|nr:hypothetical protein EDB86DRAFT_940416 [Lactarius hatsudake]
MHLACPAFGLSAIFVNCPLPLATLATTPAMPSSALPCALHRQRHHRLPCRMIAVQQSRCPTPTLCMYTHAPVLPTGLAESLQEFGRMAALEHRICESRYASNSASQSRSSNSFESFPLYFCRTTPWAKWWNMPRPAGEQKPAAITLRAKLILCNSASWHGPDLTTAIGPLVLERILGTKSLSDPFSLLGTTYGGKNHGVIIPKFGGPEACLTGH